MRAVEGKARGIAPAMDHHHHRRAFGQAGQLAGKPLPVERQAVGQGVGADGTGIVGHVQSATSHGGTLPDPARKRGGDAAMTAT